MDTSTSPLTRVMALHALAYCERLFYLEEVEEIRLADANVYAGRRLHEELADDETLETLEIEDAELGLIGKLDAIRTRSGESYPYEHKRGRSCDGQAWLSDRIQVGAYAMLLEKSLGRPVTQARIRYHRDNKTVMVPIDDHLRQEVLSFNQRGNILRQQLERPPITRNENLCIACSLSPVCLPEETRKLEDAMYEPVRLFPSRREKQTLHLLSHGERLSRQGETLKVVSREQGTLVLPIEDISEIVLHGYSQASTQALLQCAWHDIPVHWFTAGGSYICSLTTGVGRVQQRIQQYNYLAEEQHCLQLAKTVVQNRMENQTQYLMRLTRGDQQKRNRIQKHLRQMRNLSSRITAADSRDRLRGCEGACGNLYFSALRLILNPELPPEMQFVKRTRRPPRDRFNAILSFGYQLLYRSVMSAILQVGLEPSLGFYHTPRSSAHPLVMDLMELFRLPIWDQVVVSSVSRNHWDIQNDFSCTPAKVWLSEDGRRKAIALFENRLNDTWKHPVLNYSLSYGRQLELEVRLLEKCWTEGKSLFATSRIR
jgi:CRISPR-associated protein Cas1